MNVLSFTHRDAALETGWTLLPAAAQQLQVLAEAFSNLNHHEILDKEKGRQFCIYNDIIRCKMLL